MTGEATRGQGKKVEIRCAEIMRKELVLEEIGKMQIMKYQINEGTSFKV